MAKEQFYEKATYQVSTVWTSSTTKTFVGVNRQTGEISSTGH